MKNSQNNKTCTLFVFFFCCIISCYAQMDDEQEKLNIIANLPLTDNPKNWAFSKTVKTTLKPTRYKKMAKKHLKGNENQLAMLCLMQGVAKSKRRGQIKRFKKLLTKDLVSITLDGWSKEQREIEKLIQEKSFITQVKEQLKLIHHLKYLKEVNQLIATVDPLKEYKSISLDQKIEEDLRNSYKENKANIAPYYYKTAQNLESHAQTKPEWKKVSAYYAICNLYTKEYQDVEKKEKQAIENSIYTVNIQPETIQSQNYRRLDKSLQLIVTDKVSGVLHRVKLPHMKLFTSEVPTDYSIHLAISDIDVQHSDIQTTNVDYQREITTGKDSNGNEIKKTVSAKAVIYSKESKTHLKIFVEIRDNSSNEIIHSKTLTGSNYWNDRWFKLTGNKEALTKKQKRLLPYSTSPQERPSNLKMIQGSVASTIKGIMNFLSSDFIYEKGGIIY
ncbi:hypothetical protein [Aquimarina megaterium]|uniref:hypothetical protein n=1 Tax=Aquimarina megaterium TaxID=1443666 RepID=UPI0004ACF10B|nr:hypothetical protein [Aquimarina megaterium]